jgi:hypothetical protein
VPAADAAVVAVPQLLRQYRVLHDDMRRGVRPFRAWVMYGCDVKCKDGRRPDNAWNPAVAGCESVCFGLGDRIKVRDVRD